MYKLDQMKLCVAYAIIDFKIEFNFKIKNIFLFSLDITLKTYIILKN